MGVEAVVAEPGRHISHRDRGVGTQGGQAQTDQDVDQLCSPTGQRSRQYLHRQGGQEVRTPPRGDDHRPLRGHPANPCRQTGGKRPIGHPDSAPRM